MAKMVFVLVGRELVDGGMKLLFRCGECEEQVSLIILDADELRERYPVACPCGTEVNMYFGAPRVARALLKAMKEEPPPTSPHVCHSPLLN
jgi:hypothetical protein